MRDSRKKCLVPTKLRRTLTTNVKKSITSGLECRIQKTVRPDTNRRRTRWQWCWPGWGRRKWRAWRPTSFGSCSNPRSRTRCPHTCPRGSLAEAWCCSASRAWSEPWHPGEIGAVPEDRKSWNISISKKLYLLKNYWKYKLLYALFLGTEKTILFGITSICWECIEQLLMW